MTALPGLGEIEHRVDVHLEGQLPFLVTDIGDIFERCLVSGVVDENIDPSEILYGTGDHRPTVVGTAQVAGDQDGVASFGLDQSLHLMRVVVLVEIGDDDIGAFARIGERDRAADAAIRACDHGFLAVELARAAITGFAVVWARVHLRGRARHRLFLVGIRRLGIIRHEGLR